MVDGAPPLQNRAFEVEGRPDLPAVLLVHGLGGGPHEVQRLGEAIAARGLTAHGILLPGHEIGPSRMPASAWADWHGALASRYEALRARFATVHLVGFSTGATLSLLFAADAGITGRLVLLAPFVRVFRPRLSPIAPERLVRALRFVSEVPRLPPPLRDRATRDEVARCTTFRTFNLDATRSALDLVARAVDAAPRVRAPTLVVQGARDSVVDPAGARDLAARLPGGGRLAWMTRSDHLVTLDEDRAEVLREVVAFLDAGPADRSA